jgi:hypothetical protein
VPLDALLAPSTDSVGEVYQWLRSILGATVVQQAESSLLYRVKASILLPPPTNPKDGGQNATQGAPEAGTTSSTEGFSIYECLIQPSARSELQRYGRHHPGDDGAQSQPCMWNPC